jgi:hypothetical protein
MKRKIAALITTLALGASLAACGEYVDDEKAEKECLDAGGRVTRVAGQATCERNGETLAEWHYVQ